MTNVWNALAEAGVKKKDNICLGDTQQIPDNVADDDHLFRFLAGQIKNASNGSFPLTGSIALEFEAGPTTPCHSLRPASAYRLCTLVLILRVF